MQRISETPAPASSSRAVSSEPMSWSSPYSAFTTALHQQTLGPKSGLPGHHRANSSPAEILSCPASTSPRPFPQVGTSPGGCSRRVSSTLTVDPCPPIKRTAVHRPVPSHPTTPLSHCPCTSSPLPTSAPRLVSPKWRFDSKLPTKRTPPRLRISRRPPIRPSRHPAQKKPPAPIPSWPH
jgi:hypothetical protein